MKHGTGYLFCIYLGHFGFIIDAKDVVSGQEIPTRKRERYSYMRKLISELSDSGPRYIILSDI